jgi:hypothetical protein
MELREISLAELQRGAMKIKAQVLSELGIADARAELERELGSASAKRGGATKRGVPEKREKAEPAPKRRSSRVAGNDAEGNVLPEKPAPTPSYSDPVRERPEGTLQLMERVVRGSKEEHAVGVLAALRLNGGAGAGAGSGAMASPRRAGAPSPGKGKATTRALSALASLEVQSEEYVIKALPGNANRVYSIGFHPAGDKLCAIMGGRFGDITLWCPDAGSGGGAGAGAGPSSESLSAAEKAEGKEYADEEDAGGSSAMRSMAQFSLHSSVINSFKVPPVSPSCLITTSYDGSIRCTDLTSRISHEVLIDDDCPSSIDVDTATGSGWAGGFTFFVGNRAGAIYHLDTRLSSAATSTIEGAHGVKKVTSVSLSAAGGPYLCSSGSDGLVNVWDVRKLPVHSKSGGGTKKATPLDSFVHGSTVTSAFFNASGSRIMSCCNEKAKENVGYLRVFAMAGGKGTTESSTPHNNHTGRWLAPFKAVWDPANDDTFLIGDMKRGVNLYSAKAAADGDTAPQATLTGDLLTAVPTQVAAHPTLAAVVGGTASGRTVMWTS